MPNFLEGSYDGAAVLIARLNSSCILFCGRSDDVLERLVKDVDGSVDTVRVINPSKVVIDGDAAESFGLYEVSGVRRYPEDNVASMEVNNGVG